jgi:hypothetical protein
MSALTDRTQFEQLGLHVDATAFETRVKGERLDNELREQLGSMLHEVYRMQRCNMAENDEERAQLAIDKAMRSWNELDEIFRESSRLQADDIPRKLRLINCFMATETKGRVAVEQFESDEGAKLAEAEHERFNAERLRQQWQLGERDPSKRKSPFLVPWRDLEPKWRSLDQCAVAAIPSVLMAVGWRIYRVT